MNARRLSDDECINARDALTLPLKPGASPFGLSDEESNYRPDDWAWLFLSLNQDYRNEYDKRADDRDLDLTHELVEEQISGLKADSDGECAKRFGLSAWIPPMTSTLPRMLYSSDSWFFPLMRLITEDSHKKGVSSAQYKSTLASFGPPLAKPSHILTNEATFGYRPPLHARLPRTYEDTPNNPLDWKHNISSWSNVWAAIDCSIPPAAQIAALHELAQATYSQLKEDGGWAKHDGYWDCATEEIARSDIFSHMHFPYAAGVTDKVSDMSSVWRAVVIDPLGSIGEQRDILLRELQKVHRDLITKGLAKDHPLERFQNMLPPKQDNDGTYRNGGSYLKALFTLAELCDRGCTDPERIAQIVGTHSPSDRYPYNWMRDFNSNIDRYIDEARHMVNGGYHLLIHAQKPDT